MIDFSVFLKRLALGTAMKKAAPRRISRSGAEGAKADFFSSIATKYDGSEFLIKAILPDGVEAMHWDGNEFRDECCLSNAELATATIRTRRFYGLLDVEYGSHLELLIRETLMFPALQLLAVGVSQSLYARRTPERSSRAETLGHLVERRIGRTNGRNEEDALFDREWSTASSILVAKHGLRVYSHPAFFELLAHQDLVLESLEASNDAEKNNDRYRARGQAIFTIAAMEEADRKHRIAVRQANAMILLTIALVIVGLLQVFATALDYLPKAN